MTKLLEEKDIPQVAVGFMNEVHAEETALVNTLHALIERCRAGESIEGEIDRSLEEWLAHTEAHFERENRLMREHGFPAYAIHSEEHDRALTALRLLRKNWLDNRDIDVLMEYVQVSWPQWFERHVSTMDTVTAMFFQQCGVTSP